MAKPNFNISDLVSQLQGGAQIPPGPTPDMGAAPVGGPPMGAPMGAGAMPPPPPLPSLPAARPKKSGGKKRKKGGGGY